MAENEGIEIPISIETQGTEVTIEKLAAKILELEGAVSKLGTTSKKTAEEMAQGFLQGLGQKAFDNFSDFMKGIPGQMEAAVQASAAWAESLTLLAQRSGFAVKELQSFSLAAKTSGLELSQLTRFSNTLTPKLLSNEKAFASLGLSASQLRRDDPSEVFSKVISKLQGIEDPAKRAAASIQLFGQRLGPQLQPFIAGLEDARKRAESLGLTIGDDLVKSMNEYKTELDTLKEVQDATTRSFGSFITADEDIRKALKQTTDLWGDFNVAVQGAADKFHELPASVKIATAGLVTFGGKLAGIIPDLIGFAVAIKTLGGFGVIFTAIKAGFLSAAVAAGTFMTTILPIVAVIAAIALAWKFGEWLSGFKGITDAAQKLLEKLNLLPDAAERAASEVSKAGTGQAGSGLKGEDFTKAIQAANVERDKLRAKNALILSDEKAIAEVSLEQLEHQKALLGLQGQIADATAQRSGALAAAIVNQQQAVKAAQLDFAIAKEKLIFQKLGADVEAAELAKLQEKLSLTIQVANIAKDQSARQEELRILNESVNRMSTVAEMEAKIADAREFGLTALEQIADREDDTVQAAVRAHDAKVLQLEAERDILKLSGQRLADNRKAIEAADKQLEQQKSLATAVTSAAIAARELAFAQEHGLDVTQQSAKAMAELLAQLAQVEKNPKALVNAKDVGTMDKILEASKRLGVSIQDLGVEAGVTFEEFQRRADELATRLSDQGITKAIEEIERKLRTGVKLKPEDLQSLIQMREGLSASSTKARELEAEIVKVGAAVRALARVELVKEDAVRLADMLVQKEEAKLKRSKEYRKEVELAAIAQLKALGYTDAQAKKMVENNSKTQEWAKGVDSVLTGLGGVLNMLENIGVSADSAAGQFLAMGQSALQAAESGKQAKAAWDSGNKAQAVAAGLGTVGNIVKGSQTQNQGKATAQGALQGAAFGAQFGPYGAAIGAVAGGLIGFFSSGKFKKIAKDAGKVLGEGLSDETIKKIQEDSKKLGISIQKASLLNVSTAMADTGKAANTFGPAIKDLVKAIADGSVPAAEGLAELAKSFGAVASEALKAGTVGDRALVGIIKQTRASGVESPEIKAFVGEQLNRAAAGFERFASLFKKQTQEEIDKIEKEGGKAFAGLSDDAVKKLAGNTGTIFGAVFNSLVSEEGIVGAVDKMKGSFETLQKRLSATLGPEAVNKILGPFGAAFETIGNEKLRPIFEGIDGLSQTMQGLANSAFLTTDQFTAMQQATGTLFEEAIAGGADMKTALQAVAPSIQAAISAAEQFGVPLDASTQKLKEQAEANGIAFKTTPMEKMVDILVSIADVLGAKIPDSVKKMEQSVTQSTDAIVAGSATSSEAMQKGFQESARAALDAGKDTHEAWAAGMKGAEEASKAFGSAHMATVAEAIGWSNTLMDAGTTHVEESFAAMTMAGDESWAKLTEGSMLLSESLSGEIPDAASVALESLQELQAAAAEGIDIGGGATAGGTNGPRAVNANVSVNLGINENPLASADTAAQMRQTSIQWTADAIQDRLPAIIAALE